MNSCKIMQEGRQRSEAPSVIRQASTMLIPVNSWLLKKERCNPVHINSRLHYFCQLIEKLQNQIILPVQTENDVLYDN